MARPKKVVLSADSEVLAKRVLEIETEMNKLEAEKQTLLEQIKQIEAAKVIDSLAFDKVITFRHKKELMYGKIVGMFKDAVVVNLCDAKGKEIERPEGAKRWNLEAKLKLTEIIDVL